MFIAHVRCVYMFINVGLMNTISKNYCDTDPLKMMLLFKTILIPTFFGQIYPKEKFQILDNFQDKEILILILQLKQYIHDISLGI